MKFLLRLVMICLFPWATGCSASSTDPYPSQIHATIRVVSLQEYWPWIEREAREWRPDAYLYQVNFTVQIDGVSFPPLFADIRSPSNPDEALGLTLDTDGQLATQIFETDVELNQTDPILPNEILDSQDALDLMLTPERSNFIIDYRAMSCSLLILKRDGGLSNSPAVWSLVLSNCAGNPNPDPLSGTIIKIDALTGIELGND